MKIGKRLIEKTRGVLGWSWQITNTENGGIDGWIGNKEQAIKIARAKAKEEGDDVTELFAEVFFDEPSEAEHDS
jgi:hypothetical protein